MQETKPVFPERSKFQPSDEQLVQHYLFNKISGTAAPFLCYNVRDEDLYGVKEPWEIWNQFGGPNLEYGEDLYFFSHLKKKKKNGSRIDRKVGSGVWQGEDGGKVIKSLNSEWKIGYKKMFRYENEGSSYNGCWIMYEYTLNASLLPLNLQSSDCVLCGIRNNGEAGAAGKTNSRKKTKLDGQGEDIQQPEPVLVENHQGQNVQENQPQSFTEQAPGGQIQPFQNHQLMQQTPSYFFRAQEETHQQSMTEQNPQDLQLSEYHQNMQLTPVTEQNSHEQLQLQIPSDINEYQHHQSFDDDYVLSVLHNLDFDVLFISDEL